MTKYVTFKHLAGRESVGITDNDYEGKPIIKTDTAHYYMTEVTDITPLVKEESPSGLEDEHEHDLEEALTERDYWEGKATELAEALGKYFNQDFGEHSSANCPVENALEWVCGPKESPWIDAEDRLPKENQVVLVQFQWLLEPLVSQYCGENLWLDPNEDDGGYIVDDMEGTKWTQIHPVNE